MGLLDQFMNPQNSGGLLAAAAQIAQGASDPSKPYGLLNAFGDGTMAFQKRKEFERLRQVQQEQLARDAEADNLRLQGMQGDLAFKEQQRERMERIRKALESGGAGAPQATGAPMQAEQPMVAPSPNEPDWMTAHRAQAPQAPMAGGGAPSAPAAGAGSQVVAQLTKAAQVYTAEGDIEGANKLLEQAAKFRSKFSTTPQVMRGPDGKLINVVLNDEGQPQILPYGVAEKLNFQDTGGETVGLDAYTGDVRARYRNSQSPNNKATVGAAYANADATREIANATRQAAEIRRNQETEMKLGDDYRTQSKPFKEVSDAYRTINATLDKATMSPAATLAGATKFMKLLDPGSVVRESELGMALAASGVIDRATNYHNTLLRGRVLTKDQVADFKNITKQIYTAAQQGQQAIDQNYRKQAETYGLRPDMVVQDLGQNAKPTVPPSQAAINHLKFNPRLRAEFDAKYGEGAAAKVLGK